MSRGYLSDVINSVEGEVSIKFEEMDKNLIVAQFNQNELYRWEKAYHEFVKALNASNGKQYLIPPLNPTYLARSLGITDFRGPDNLYINDSIRSLFDITLPSDLKIPKTR